MRSVASYNAAANLIKPKLETSRAEPKVRIRLPPAESHVSGRNSRCQVEKPGFAAGVRATASGAVGRDAQGTAKSGQWSIISLSAQNPVPERR